MAKPIGWVLLTQLSGHLGFSGQQTLRQMSVFFKSMAPLGSGVNLDPEPAPETWIRRLGFVSKPHIGDEMGERNWECCGCWN